MQEVPKPKIEHPRDVILRITTSAICGSDLHMYDGHSAMQPGRILGHESMGVVEEAGDAVTGIKKGDRVVVPFNIACGVCMNCVRGHTNACLTLNPHGAGAGYGYVGLGKYGGGQAEYVRVPNGDWACLKLPGKPGDKFENDFVLLADIFPTAYYATDMAKVSAGKSVAIFGAGPVGLLSALSCKLKGASDVYVVDKSEKRLGLAESMGATPINFLNGDPVDQIFAHRKANGSLTDSLRPGEEKMLGVDCGIDAVGYQAFDREHPDQFKANQVLLDLARIINPTGALGIIGVYLEQDPAGKNQDEQHGNLVMPIGKMWAKSISFETGQTPVKLYHAYLRDLIISGKAKPSFIVTDQIRIDDAPATYREFDKRDQVVKAVIKFPGAAEAA